MIITASLTAVGKKKYKLVDAEITPKDLCGATEGWCYPGNTGIPFRFIEPYSPNVKDGITKQDIAASLIGRSYDEDDRSGSAPQVPAEENDPTPFNNADIAPIGSISGRDLKYKKTVKLDLKVNASVQANLDDIKKVLPNVNSTQIAQIEADLKAAYEKVKGTEITITANYTEWELSSDVISDIKRGLSKYKKCKEYLQKHKQRLITSIGLVYYNLKYNENSLDDLAASLDAKFKAYSLPVNIGVSFKKQISVSIDADYQNGYQIIGWRTIDTNDFGG